MSIRKRLILSNIAMILVPIILFGVTAFILTNLLLGDLQNPIMEQKQHFWQHNIHNGSGAVQAEFARTLFPLLFLSLIFILIITNGLLSYFVSKSIITPVNELMIAAKLISEGDLSFRISSKRNDELGQLSMAFEKMRQKLKESTDVQLQYEENRKELIANISHDLKTPITAIKGYVEGIRDGVANTPEKMEKYIQTINTKANDLDQLIDELFLYSKLDLRRVPFHFEQVDVKAYLLDLIEEIQFDLDKDRISFQLDFEEKQDYGATIDREKLKRVIMNIINNSLKYMDKDVKKLKLLLKCTKDSILVEIKDNGAGISADALPFIFDRFYRADPSRNNETGGSGLGLAIVKRIIEEHGGQIWAESELGKGTSIYFTLKKSMKVGK